MLAAGFKVGPPLNLHGGWDLMSRELFNLLCQLSAAGRIAMLWLSPPARSFCVIRRPRLRTKEEPWGIDPSDAETALGNLHVHQSLFLFRLQEWAGNHAVVTTPWSAYTRSLPWWKASVVTGVEIRSDLCRFGSPYLKSTSLLCTSVGFAPLGRHCRCKRAHVKLQGTALTAAVSYPDPFCQEVARLARQLAQAQKVQAKTAAEESSGKGAGCGSGETRDHKGAQRFVSHLWSSQLAESLPWRTVRAYRFPHPNHINILECHVHKTLMQVAPRDCRLLAFQDSMVTLGSTAKGRSASVRLNRILRQSMTLQLAKNIYATAFHSPTWAIRADDPSRGRRVKPPRVPLPGWLLSLRRGGLTEAQDALDACSGTPRSWSRWLLLGQACVLAAAGGYNSVREWTQTSGGTAESTGSREGEGHRANSAALPPAVGRFSAVGGGRGARQCTAARPGQIRSNSVGNGGGGIRPGHVRTRRHPEELCGDPECPAPEVCVPQAVLSRTVETPHDLGVPLSGQGPPSFPTPVVESCGHHFAGLGLDQIRDTGCSEVIFLRLTLVKSRTRGAKMQSVRVDVPYVVHFLKKVLRTMSSQEKLWPYSSSLFRTRLQQVLQATAGDKGICVPSSLRPGGATFWFRQWQEDLVRLQWRGRWLHFKTLAHYIQEVGCINVMDSLAPAFRSKVLRLADLCEPACSEVAPQVDLNSQVQRLMEAFYRQFPHHQRRS